MKILLLSTGGYIGGEETFTRNLALGLIKRGHSVWVTPGGPVQRKDLEEHHIPVADIQIESRGPLGLLKASRDVGRFIDLQQVEVVHCQAVGPVILGGIIRMRKKAPGTRWFYHGHGVQKGTYRWLPCFLNMLDFSMAVSDYEMIQLIARGVKRNKIARIHNGIDPDTFSFSPAEREKKRRAIRKELKIRDDTTVFGYVGRLSPEKGCDMLMPAFGRALDQLDGAQMVIVGDGIMRSSLEASLADDSLKSHVRLTGFRSDIPELMCGMDVLIMPSYKETFSLTSLQAMAAGLPVISSDVCGNPEQVIPGYNGELFDSGNIDALAEAMIRMYKRDDRLELGTNGNRLVKSYLNEERMIDEIVSYYRKFQE